MLEPYKKAQLVTYKMYVFCITRQRLTDSWIVP